MSHGLDVLRRRAALARIFTLIFMSVLGLTLAFELAELAQLFTLEVESPLQTAAIIVYLGSSLAFILSAIFVGMWIHRAHANLITSGLEGLEFSPSWSVGWFFIPIANLFKPFEAMRELWNASHDETNSYNQPAPRELSIWWGLFIVSNALMNIGGRMEATPESQSIGLVLSATGTVISVACAYFLMQIIKQVTEAQNLTMSIRQTFA